MTLLDPSHLRGIVVIIRERLVDVRDIYGVSLGDSVGGGSALFDARMHVSDGDAAPLDVGAPREFPSLRPR